MSPQLSLSLLSRKNHHPINAKPRSALSHIPPATPPGTNHFGIIMVSHATRFDRTYHLSPLLRSLTKKKHIYITARCGDCLLGLACQIKSTKSIHSSRDAAVFSAELTVFFPRSCRGNHRQNPKRTKDRGRGKEGDRPARRGGRQGGVQARRFKQEYENQLQTVNPSARSGGRVSSCPFPALPPCASRGNKQPTAFIHSRLGLYLGLVANNAGGPRTAPYGTDSLAQSCLEGHSLFSARAISTPSPPHTMYKIAPRVGKTKNRIAAPHVNPLLYRPSSRPAIHIRIRGTAGASQVRDEFHARK